jgi:hypothetical protein
MTKNQGHCSHFVKEAIKHMLAERELCDTFGVPLELCMSMQKQKVPFLNVPLVVRLCTDAMIQKGKRHLCLSNSHRFKDRRHL